MHSKLIMKQVQRNWRAMSEQEKEYYKEQSKINRNEYEEKKRTFDQQKQTDFDSLKLNVIEVIQGRRAERQARKQYEQEQEIIRQ